MAAGLLVPLTSAPQSKSSSGGFSIMLTVRPEFRILEVRSVPGGNEYRVWTNLKKVQLNGHDYRFERVGEATVVVPGPLIELPARQAP